MTVAAPARIEIGPVVLVLQGPDDAEELAELINGDLPHLEPWMPWAHRPTNAHEQAMRLAVGAENAMSGGDAGYSITVTGRVAGGCGLHRRAGDSTLDIGYWIAVAHEGRGYVTSAATGLTRVAFDLYGASSVRITCDEANVRSAAVPRRLGFTHTDTIDEERNAPADTNRTMVWVLTADEWPESPGFRVTVSYA